MYESEIEVYGRTRRRTLAVLMSQCSAIRLTELSLIAVASGLRV